MATQNNWGNQVLDAAVTFNGGTMNIGSDATDNAINVGTAANAGRTLTIGNVTGTTGVNFNTGTSGSVFTTTNGVFTLATGTGQINISADAAATTVNIASGGAAKVVQLGSTNGASSLALRYGTADFTLASATGTTMSVLDTGEMTMPLQSAFLALNSTPRANVTGDGTGVSHVIFDTEIFDQNADYDNGTYTFTAPVTGRYRFSFNIFFQQVGAAHTTVTSSLVTSNRTYYGYYQGGGNNIDVAGNLVTTGDFLCDMDAADTAYVGAGVYNGAKVVDINGDALAVTTFGGSLMC
jgi:hypothetical protein